MYDVLCFNRRPPEPFNAFETYADDFVSEFHKSPSPAIAVETAKKFLEALQQWGSLEQGLALRRAVQVDDIVGKAHSPRLEMEFTTDEHGNKILSSLNVLTFDEAKSQNFTVLGLKVLEVIARERTPIFHRQYGFY